MKIKKFLMSKNETSIFDLSFETKGKNLFEEKYSGRMVDYVKQPILTKNITNTRITSNVTACCQVI